MGLLGQVSGRGFQVTTRQPFSQDEEALSVRNWVTQVTDKHQLHLVEKLIIWGDVLVRDTVPFGLRFFLFVCPLPFHSQRTDLLLQRFGSLSLLNAASKTKLRADSYITPLLDVLHPRSLSVFCTRDSLCRLIINN